MSNKLFFTLMILGTIMLLFVLFPQEQSVDAEQLEATTNPNDSTQIALTQLKSFFMDSKSPDKQENLESKIQALEYKQQVQLQALEQPQKSLEEICTSMMNDALSAPKQMDNQPQGIFELEEDFLGDRGYLTNNMWRGEYSGYETEVYAGSLFSDRQQGVLILNIPALSYLKFFSDPASNGSLSITEMDGYQVRLSATNGNTIYFDLPAQQFTNDLAKSMSVSDLPALPTPIADPCAEFTTP